MEIHPPRRIATIKEFFKELLTITVGILIALSLEGLLEWRHHRELAREARANILSELRENQRELKTEEQDLDKMQQQARKLVNLVHRLENNRKAPSEQVQLIWTFAELHTTSWAARPVLVKTLRVSFRMTGSSARGWMKSINFRCGLPRSNPGSGSVCRKNMTGSLASR